MADDKTQASTIDKKPKSFEALTPALAEWILDYTRSMGFARTTPVQAMAIPLLMGNKDLVVEVRSLLSISRSMENLTRCLGCDRQWQDPIILDPDSDPHIEC